MLDRSKPADLSIPSAVAFVLALCVASLMIASCGAPATDASQIISPSPPGVMPTLTTATKATGPVREQASALVGKWAEDDDFVLELSSNGALTLSYRYDQADSGTWSLREDGSLVLEGLPYVAVPHGNLLLLDAVDGTATLHILHRVDDNGNLLAFEPANAIEVPPIDSSAILSISIVDGWTGLSPVAPIEAYFRLEPTPDNFSGMAEFSVAGYTEAITRSVPISVPLAVIEELIALLGSTPLEVGKYKPLFNHTDDFPNIIITLEGRAGDLGFASKSQGREHIPWQVVVGEDQYVTYADTPAQALDLLDPYLAREVQQALFDLALARDQ